MRSNRLFSFFLLFSFLLASFAFEIAPRSLAEADSDEPGSGSNESEAIYDEQGKIHKNEIGMEFVFVPKGKGILGMTDSQLRAVLRDCARYFQACTTQSFSRETPQRSIEFSEGFWIGRFEVTQGQWRAVMGRNPSNFPRCGADCPIENVTWEQVKEFISKLNQKTDGMVYSLPSETEWEYAARAGTDTHFAFGDNLSSSMANFNGARPFGTSPAGKNIGAPIKVGSFSPNAWGLYDMHGNVSEFVEDVFTADLSSRPTNGSANSIGDPTIRTQRGGSWKSVGFGVRSSSRSAVVPSRVDNAIGLRVVARRVSRSGSGDVEVGRGEAKEGEESSNGETSDSSNIESVSSVNLPKKPALDTRDDGEALLWNEMVKRDNKSGYQFYISEFPSGRHVETAKNRINDFDSKEEDDLWNTSKRGGTSESLNRYLAKYPEGRYATEAKSLIASLAKSEDRQAWERAEELKTEEGYREYVRKFPRGDFISLARLRLVDMGLPFRIGGEEIETPLGIQLVWIPDGSFMMGSPSTEAERSSDEGPQRLVTIRQGFWMGRFEVTQGQYEAVMGTNPSNFKNCGMDCPVETVSWNDAKEFIKRLNDRNDGFVYSLPTEAEWEYAARAGTTTATAFGNSLSSTQANFNGNFPYGNAAKGPYLERTTRVGSYRPNAWGLYDMHGNVWEWVEDIWQDSYNGLPTDGSANTMRGNSSRRVLRGGSWNYFGNNTRSAYRFWYNPTDRGNGFGFRVFARAR